MEQFNGNHGLAAVFGLSGAFVLALDAYLVFQAVPRVSTFTVISAAAGIFCVGGNCAVGLFLLYGAREAGAGFVVNNEGITRRTWGKETTIAWRDLVRLKEYQATRFKGMICSTGRCVLYDANGRRLAIPFPWVVDGRHLRALLEPHLTGLREAELHDLARLGGRFRPARTAGVLLLTCIAPMFLICGLTTFDTSGVGRGQLPEKWPYTGVALVAISAVLALLGIELVSQELVITADGLALRSLFLDRSIPFVRIESITVKVVDAEDPGIERLTVRGNGGQKIAIDSAMPCYLAVLDLLRSRAVAKPAALTTTDPDFA